MLRLTTRNSVYEVRTVDGGFNVTKVEALSESNFNAVGQSRFSREAYIHEGQSAIFDDWHTSTVRKIEDIAD